MSALMNEQTHIQCDPVSESIISEIPRNKAMKWLHSVEAIKVYPIAFSCVQNIKVSQKSLKAPKLWQEGKPL